MNSTPPTPANAFATTLTQLGDGSVLQELSETLQEVSAAVTALHQKGEIILRLKLKPSAGGTISVSADVDRKIPRHGNPESLFYPTASGLSRNNPAQQELQLRAIPATAPAAPATPEPVRQVS